MATFAHASESTPENIHEMLAVWGREIAEARIRFGLTETDFATCLFVAPTTISRLERGDPKVSLGIFVNALWALGLNERLDAEFVSIEEVFCVPGEEVDCVPEADLSSKNKIEAIMSIKTPFGPALMSKTTGHMSEATSVWGPIPKTNPVQQLQTKLQDINRTTLQAGAENLQRLSDNLKEGTKNSLLSIIRASLGRNIQHVDLRFFQARAIDALKGLVAVGSNSEKVVRRAETRRERRRRIICRAVAHARHLNGDNTNVPPPSCAVKTR